GAVDSIIGVRKDSIIKSFLNQMPMKHEPETSGQMVLNSVMIEIDDKTKKALNIYHIQKFSD
ncbi:metallophosphoesterase, partial [Candidatus Peregrinibacteria bacterium]|nr:metallophosphoesterase [Candidatus Peregrinibacteria bacterium]